MTMSSHFSVSKNITCVLFEFFWHTVYHFEINNQLKSLESQAKKAEKYHEIKNEYREVSIELAKASLEGFNLSYKDLNEQQEKETDQVSIVPGFSNRFVFTTNVTGIHPNRAGTNAVDTMGSTTFVTANISLL